MLRAAILKKEWKVPAIRAARVRQGWCSCAIPMSQTVNQTSLIVK